MKHMKSIGLILFVGLSATAALAETVNFDNAPAGAVPPGWTVAMTHKGGAPRWEVVKDDSAPSKPNVLGQLSSDRTGGRFPLAIWDKTTLTDGTLTVKFKAISGSVDQGAGL